MEFKNTNEKFYTKPAELKNAIEHILENAELKIANWGKFALFYSAFFPFLRWLFHQNLYQNLPMTFQSNVINKKDFI